jgi:hypothetical protein
MSRDDEPVGSLWRLAVHEVGHGIVYVAHGGTITALAAQPWVQSGGINGYCEAELSADITSSGRWMPWGARMISRIFRGVWSGWKRHGTQALLWRPGRRRSVSWSAPSLRRTLG